MHCFCTHVKTSTASISPTPTLEFEPDVEAFMDRIITYVHMAATIIGIEEYAAKLEAAAADQR